MKAILHIGLAKTGSSTIQAFLDDNRRALAAQSVRFERFESDFPNNVEFAIAARLLLGEEIPRDTLRQKLRLPDLDAQTAFTRRFSADFAARRADWGEDLYVGSSEHIAAWARRPRHIRALDAFLAEHFTDVSYVLYLRRQEETILSSYSERIKRGDTDDFDTHLEKRLAASLFATVRMWANTVGRERLSVRLLERDALVGGDLLEDVCALIGVDGSAMQRPKPQNESLSAEAAELLRRLNMRLPPFTARGRSRRLRRIIQRILMWMSSGKPRQALSQAQFDRIRAANAADNEKLRQAWFPDRAELFPARAAVVRPEATRAKRSLLTRVAHALGEPDS